VRKKYRFGLPKFVARTSEGILLSIENAYLDAITGNSLSPDPVQQSIVDSLQQLQTRLERKPGLWQKTRRLIPGPNAQNTLRGMYLWGSVGRGKTFLMDLFFETLKVPEKRRIHFHRIMREVHDRLNSSGNVENPLDKIAAAIASNTRVLCFDEFFVNDIGDAMILDGLLKGLFQRGVTLVATSNSAPQRLYWDGLQRERFLPAIAMLERYTNVVAMNGEVDYRLSAIRQAGTYLTPADTIAHDTLQQFFLAVAPRGTMDARVLDILGRKINALRCAKGVVWFDFQQICDGPRSQNDYIEIARWYQTVIISDISVLNSGFENRTRRFIALVDEFYDRRVKLILSAAASIDTLYQGSTLRFEFQRTASRLTQMQSEEYLHWPHIP